MPRDSIIEILANNVTGTEVQYRLKDIMLLTRHEAYMHIAPNVMTEFSFGVAAPKPWRH